MSNLFGINGVRGVVNETLTSDVALKLGRAIGRYYDGPVAVATDTRISADMIKNAVMAGLLAEGCDVFDLGVVPVPAVQYFVKNHDDILGGIMITASHNTAEYNGVKCITSTGDELGEAGQKKIEENYDSNMPSHANRIGTVTSILRAGEEYVSGILEHVKVNDIRRANLRVVVDCANGSTSSTTPALLQRLGVYTVTLNANPQGEFPGRPSEPTEENLSDVIALIKTAGADLGVAHDLDGDRVSFISNEGKFIEGDEALAIMAKYVLSRKTGVVVTTVSTSSVVEDVVKKNDGEEERWCARMHGRRVTCGRQEDEGRECCVRRRGIRRYDLPGVPVLPRSRIRDREDAGMHPEIRADPGTGRRAPCVSHGEEGCQLSGGKEGCHAAAHPRLLQGRKHRHVRRSQGILQRRLGTGKAFGDREQIQDILRIHQYEEGYRKGERIREVCSRIPAQHLRFLP